MKNEDIHSDIPKKEIRDFLGQWSHREGFLGDASEIKYLEKTIKEAEERLIHCRNHRAVITLIKSNGWKEFDISDEISYRKDTYFPFIGTEEEFESLKNKIKNEEIK